VKTLVSWGRVTSCNPGGSGGGRLYARWTEYFRDLHVAIPFDNDEAGRKHALEKAALLINTCASIRIIELPGLPEAGDITDWRDAGGTLDEFLALTEAAETLNKASIAELCVRWGMGEKSQREHARADPLDWPRPAPIGGALPPVKAFSEDLLPDSLRPLVADVSRRMQVAPDCPGVVTMLALAGTVSRRARIQPKARDTDWEVIPNLFGGCVGEPGLMKKSGVIQSCTRPANRIQAEWHQAHEEALKN